MTRVAGMVICSSLGVVLGAGVALAATSWLSEISAAQQSLQEAVTHLQAAQDIPHPMVNYDTAIHKAAAYIALAKAELEAIPKLGPLENPKGQPFVDPKVQPPSK